MSRFNAASRAVLIARIKSEITRKRLIIAGLVALGLFILTPIVTYAFYAHDISDRERLMNRNNTGVILKDKDGNVFYEYGTINKEDDVPLSQISDHLEKAVIASEDREFYTHQGFSIKGIVAAAYANLMNKDVSRYGGSTITQQLVKNKLLSSDKNFLRKYQEIAMAIAIERRYTKSEILNMYINSVYYGEGAFGIAQASDVYFGKEPKDLTLAESSQLVGLLPAPSAYSPISGDTQLAEEKQRLVLRKMVQNEYITAAESREAANVALSYAEGSAQEQDTAQHFAAMVIDQLNEKYGEERVTRSGFEVVTTLDMKWQKTAESIIKKRVAATSSNGGRNASLVAEDPKTGEVRALVGSVDWSNKAFGQVNMATALRQPGSSFKPIYYSKALEQRLVTPATVLDDKKTTFGGTYTPRNFDNRYKGKMTLRSALAESRNVPAVQVMQKLGVEDAAESAQQMGLDTVKEPSRYGLSLALGTAEVRLADMVHAYTAFANKGQQHDQVIVKEIKDKFGKTIFKHKDKKKRVRTEAAAFVLTSILSDTSARAPTFGNSLNIPGGRQIALKTGTTNENRDAWTIGYTPNLVVGAWMGNNENEPMVGLAGGSSAGLIWKQSMTEFIKTLPRENFSQPSSVVRLDICRGTESRAQYSGANTFSEYFIRGSEPTSTCNVEEIKKEEPKKEEKEDKKEEKPKNNDNGNNPTPIDPNDPPTVPTEPDEPPSDEPPSGGGGGGGNPNSPRTSL